MKKFLLLPVLFALAGCSSTWVHIDETGTKTGCNPVVSVHSFGSSVVIADNSECKGKK